MLPIARLVVFSERLDNHSAFERSLPAVALGIGIVWAGGLGLGLGVMEVGNTPGFLATADRITREGLSFQTLFGSEKGEILYHMTHLWLYWWGKAGLMAFVALLTALIPFCAVTLLRQVGVRPLLVGCALVYLAANEEIYNWAFYVLSDSLLISQVAIVLMLATVPKIRGHRWWILPVVWYSMYFCRSTAFIMHPRPPCLHAYYSRAFQEDSYHLYPGRNTDFLFESLGHSVEGNGGKG